jgi:HSP20 family protein
MPESCHSDRSSGESPADKIRDVVAGWIDVVASQKERALDAFNMRGPGKTWVPEADIVETEAQVIVLVDLPGVEPTNVDLVLVGNMLTIKGEQSADSAGVGGTVQRRERPSGPFARSIPLPVPVDPEKVSAESRNGVLTVTLARQESVKSRQIPIGVKPAGS